MLRVPMQIAQNAAGGSLFRIWNCRLLSSPAMKPYVSPPRRLPITSSMVSSPPGPSGARGPGRAGGGSPSGQPSGISHTSRRNASTSSGSGVTSFTWLMRSIGLLSSAAGSRLGWTGRGVVCARRVDRPLGSCLPRFLIDELGDRPASHRPVAPRGTADRDGRGHEDAVGDREQRAQFAARRTRGSR